MTEEKKQRIRERLARYYANRERIRQRIAYLREEKGVTQMQLAKSVGMYRTEIDRIEKGQYPISLDTLIDIAEALGMTVDIIDPKMEGLTPLKELT